MSVRENNDVLCFRVMRLNRPVFAKQPCELAELKIDEIAGSLMAFDSTVRADLDGLSPTQLFEADSSASIAVEEDVFNCAHDLVHIKAGGPSEMLNLSSLFGTAYLGEAFSAHVNMYNQSNAICYNVELKIALHNRIEWLTLYPSTTCASSLSAHETNLPRVPGPGVDLAPGQSISAVISHELKELGVYTLRCTATYSLAPNSSVAVRTTPRPGITDAQQTPGNLTFERLYKFQSNKPLDVKKAFSSVQSDGTVFMEAQVQNLTTNPIFLERVVFEPSSNMAVFDLNNLGSSLTTYNRLKLLRPENIQHFLYRLTPTGRIPSAQSNTAKSTTGSVRPLAATVGSRSLQQPPVTAGRLDITWRSTMGERGRLQTSSLKYEIPSVGDIQLKTIELPSVVQTERPFRVKIDVINRCTNPLELTLILHSEEDAISTPKPLLDAGAVPGTTKSPSVTLSPLVWMGMTTRKLGSLSPGSSVPVTLDLMATVPGLQNVSGVRIHELNSGRDYEFTNLGQVLVSAC